MADHFTIFGDKRGEELLLSDAMLMAQAQGLRDMPDGPVAVEFRRGRKGVSALQRGYWFAVVVKRIAEHTGDDTDSTHEDVKRELFQKLGLPFSITKRWRSKKTGRRRQRTKQLSITDLNTKQMTDLIDLARKWAAEFHRLEIEPPDPKWKEKRQQSEAIAS